jgi:mono/diheme cytochrome c family protein
MVFSSTVRTLFRLLLGFAGALLLAGLGGWLVLEAGWYDAGATRQHFQIVHTLLERGMQQSVRFHARDIVVPALDNPAQGAVLYKRHCQQCHGGPGVAQDLIGLSMQPVPGPLVDASRRFRANELYWVVRHGIKMSGMPAWEFRLHDEQIWALVAFLQQLPHLTPAGYRLMGVQDAVPATPGVATSTGARQDESSGTGGASGASGLASATWDSRAGRGDVARGRLALAQWACQACHRIPGVTGPETHVGPPLNSLRERRFIAGSLPMGEDNLVRWITRPHAIDPTTAMPQLGVPERDARDMAAYLLRQ